MTKSINTSISLSKTNKKILDKLRRNLEHFNDDKLTMNNLITNIIHNYINGKNINLTILQEKNIKIPENFFKK